jgi:hypothetical protein
MYSVLEKTAEVIAAMAMPAALLTAVAWCFAFGF